MTLSNIDGRPNNCCDLGWKIEVGLQYFHIYKGEHVLCKLRRRTDHCHGKLYYKSIIRASSIWLVDNQTF